MKECFPGDVSAEDVACRLDILGMQEFVLPSNTSFGQSEVTLLYPCSFGRGRLRCQVYVGQRPGS